MRRTLIILLSIITIIFAGCQNQLNSNNTGITAISPQISVSSDVQTITIMGSYRTPESLDDLVNILSYNVFIAQVEKILPAERVKLSEVAEVAAENDSNLNYTPVQVKVIKAIKGTVKDNMSLKISLHGGTAGGVNEVYDGEYGLEEGKTYLFFVTGRDMTKKHAYMLAVPYAPNPQIVDGKLVDYNEEIFFLPSGLTVDEVVQKILEVSK